MDKKANAANQSKTKNPYCGITAGDLEKDKEINSGVRETIWQEIADQNKWPDPILLKDLGPDRTPGCPYSRGHIRNLVTGQNPDPELKKEIFFIGRYPAIRRAGYVNWLDSKTQKTRG